MVDAEDGVGTAGDAIGAEQPPRAERERYDAVTGQLDEAASLVDDRPDRRGGPARASGTTRWPTGWRTRPPLCRSSRTTCSTRPCTAAGTPRREEGLRGRARHPHRDRRLRRHRRPGHQRAGRRPLRAVAGLGGRRRECIGICVFAEMSGRVAAVSGRATFDIVRERLGPADGHGQPVRLDGGHAADLHRRDRRRRARPAARLLGQLRADRPVRRLRRLADPVAGPVLAHGERARACVGLALVVFGVALWQLGPDWGDLLHQHGGRGQARRRAVADLGLLRRGAVRRRA